ncbi:MAG: discoidin domain-containing protein, partial [Myxococcota bacterium]|nr:discoidin domain-containing protein [Myxococcota bacterium]
PVVAITPAAPTADDDLVCTVVEPSTDPEGATVTTTLAWLRDGAATGLSVETVPAAQTAAGDSWTCEATGHDGTQAGPVGSASVAIAEGNRAPSAPEVAIHPSAPATNQPVTCVVETAPVDPDGDAVTVSFSWAVDGADAGITGDTLARADTAPGEEWTCVATASDGVLTSPEAVATAAITEARYTGDITGLGGTTHTASSCFLGCSDTTYQAANAFDDNRGTAGYSTWHATWTGGPEWIAVDFGAGNAWAVTRYGLMGASFHEGYRVRDFSLQGSDDGVTWITVDTVTIASLAYVIYGGEPLSYWDVDNEDAYRHWRYLITDNEGGQPWADEVGIVEIEMFADEPVE